MRLLHSQSNERLQPDDSLRAQRMTADEAASVIALWQQEQTELTGLTDRPAVPDVAEGLDITVEDVQRLLATVRAQRLEAELRLEKEQELAAAEMRLAEEEHRLAEIQRQRVELEREQIYQPSQTAFHSSWVEVKPGVWEDAEVPTVTAKLREFLRGILPVIVAIVIVVAIAVIVEIILFVSTH